MSADKRSVATDALETLGTIIGPDEARDAIHLAVENVVAGEPLNPGQDVGFLPDGRVGWSAKKHLGIVDPFLQGTVGPGERFWLVVYPRQIRSLRHVWEHPDFPQSIKTEGSDRPEPISLSAAEVAASEAQAAALTWIEDYARSLSGTDYGYDDGYHEVTADELINTAKTWVHSDWGDHLVKGGLLEGVDLNPEFWDHFQVATGIMVPSANRQSFFSCSC